MPLGANAPRWLKSAGRAVFRAAGYRLQPVGWSFDELQRALLGECDLLVDVGANVGQYVRWMRTLGYRGPVVSFEPQAAAFTALRHRASADRTWQVRRLALAAEEGEAELRISANSVSSSLLDIRTEHVSALPSSAAVGREPVSVSTLDRQLAGEPGGALWLKLDVQGTELDVLRGGSGTLDRTRVVQSEVSLCPLYDGQTDYLELLDRLRRTGFTMCHVTPAFCDSRTKQLLQVDVLLVRLGGVPGRTAGPGRGTTAVDGGRPEGAGQAGALR